MKALVIGGNHYFGRKLVRILIDNDYDVTLLNRGNRDDGFNNLVKRIKCDRANERDLRKAITEDYDIVFDQCCFDYDQAKLSCEVFNNRVKKYIFTSTVSVYNAYASDIKEEVFDSSQYEFVKKETMESNYGEAKRQAEAAFYKHADFPVTSLRFPIVLDAEDGTGRLQFHVNKIVNNEKIYFKNIESKISFISAQEAAESLYKLSINEFSGPINVASPKPISLKGFINILERELNKKMRLCSEAKREFSSPYNIENNWYVNCSLLKSLGIELTEIDSYLPNMIKKISSGK